MNEEDRHEWTRARLSEHVDGSLSPADAVAVEAHLHRCSACAALRDDLGEIAGAARTLGPLTPPTDLWPGIARAIGAGEEEGEPTSDVGAPVAPFRPARGSDRGVFEARSSRTWRASPRLAAAAVVLMAVSASLAWWGRGVLSGPAGPDTATPTATVPVRTAATPVEERVPESLAVELRELESVVEDVRGRLDPGTLEVLERNRLLIERAIEDSYRALAQDPENDFVRDHLERAYQTKVEFLREVSRMAELAG